MPAMKNTTQDQGFHAGERAAQARVGLDAHMAEIGNRVLMDHMPPQFGRFLEHLPLVLVGSTDATGQPWASVWAGQPGFMRPLSFSHLAVSGTPMLYDPLRSHLRPGASIGLLGLEPHTRRRIRVNGRVHTINDQAFVLEVQQCFGNCPKYIQARQAQFAQDRMAMPMTQAGQALDEPARSLLARADTFFIATAHPQAGAEDRAQGVDISHRGGKPGFVHVSPTDVLSVPDFHGNFYFNTLGNLELNPRAGLLFIDYECGDVLQLRVNVQVEWEGEHLARFMGAQRMLRMQELGWQRTQASLPLRWSEALLSPALVHTGSWG